MKTTTCKRCGAQIQFDTNVKNKNGGMWLKPGSKAWQGRWCQTSVEKPVQVHVPDYDTVQEA